MSDNNIFDRVDGVESKVDDVSAKMDSLTAKIDGLLSVKTNDNDYSSNRKPTSCIKAVYSKGKERILLVRFGRGFSKGEENIFNTSRYFNGYDYSFNNFYEHRIWNV